MEYLDEKETQVSDFETYLSFKLGDEAFASSVDKVLNILEMKPITKVPQSPSYLRGVINLRGNVLPVVDMRIKFGMPPTQIEKDTCIIVLSIDMDGEMVMLGILVDSVDEVLEIENSKIEPSPTIGTKYKVEFIKGMWRKEDGFIMLLNIDLIFSTEELLIVKETQSSEVRIEAK